MSAEQKEFDDIYISSSEIRELLGICRSSIFQAKDRGLLPEPIVVNGTQIQLWKRSDVMPHIAAWKQKLMARRGEVGNV